MHAELWEGRGPARASRERRLAGAPSRPRGGWPQAKRRGSPGGDNWVTGRYRVQPSIGLTERSSLVRFAPIGPQRHRPFCLCSDRERRVDPEVGRDRGTVHDMEARMAIDAVVGVDHPGFGGVADNSTAKEVCRHWDVEDVVPTSGGKATDALGNASNRVVTNGDPRRVGLTVALFGCQSSTE